MQLNVPQSTITNEYRISVLEELMQWIIEKNWGKKITLPTTSEVSAIQKKVFDRMKKKYPDWVEYKGVKDE